MRPTKHQIIQAVGGLGILRYFPAEAPARQAVMELLERMVGTAEQLDWLVRTMVDKVGEWHGPKELRGLFCTRFRPADQIEADCTTTVGFTPNELESRSIAAHEERKQLGPPKTRIPGLVVKRIAAGGK